MQNLQQILIEILKIDSTYFSNKKLLRNKLTEDALKLKPKLIKHVLSDEKLKKHFFLEVNGVLVFDKDKFIQFVNDKQFLPDSYTSFKNKIGLLDENGNYFQEKKDVVLAWPYKDCVLEGGQDKEDQKREEIFYNEILAPDEIDRLFDPKVLTNFKRYDKDGERLNPKDITRNDNLIIKGNNLLALHSLKKLFRGEVKLIYIDLPFNTERQDDSFNYNDKFNHSTWLTFMKNRLEISKIFLKNDGIICLHINDNELYHLKVLCDEVFGKSNFINNICIRDSHPSGLKMSAKEKTILKTKSYILIYSRNKDRKIYPLYQERRDWDTHFNTYVEIDDYEKPKYSLVEYLKENGIVDNDFRVGVDALNDPGFKAFVFENRHKIFQGTKEIPKEAKTISLENPDRVVEYKGSNGGREFAFNGRRLSPLAKSIWDVGFDRFSKEEFAKILCDFWDDVDFNNTQNEGGVDLPNGKKPEYLMARLLSWFTRKNDLVLDFFLGCGTTAAVSHKMGRKYIGIEQLDYGENDSFIRLKNVINGDRTGISKYINWLGGGSFIYCELKKWNQNYIDEIETAKTTKDLLLLSDKMKSESFFRYDVNLSKINKKDFSALTLDQQKGILIECLDKNHLFINLSEKEDSTYQVSKEEKEMNRKFYGL
jgi:adenine-specific DNA-methyltransferase